MKKEEHVDVVEMMEYLIDSQRYLLKLGRLMEELQLLINEKKMEDWR